MKKTLSYSIAPALVTLALLASPTWAQDPSPASSPSAVHAAVKHAQNHEDYVEQRITQLHDQLQIGDPQSKQWDNFAQTMRDNAHRTDDAMKDRAQKIGNMDAVEAMKSYAALAQQHADNMQKLVSAFNDLYSSLSDSQKKTADTLFRNRVMHQHGEMGEHHHHRHHHHHHHHKSGAPASAASAAPG